MALFLVVTIICLLLTVASDLLKYIQLSRLFLGGSLAKNVPQHYFTELDAAKAELRSIHDRSIEMEEYTRTIKVMRAEKNVQMKEQMIFDIQKAIRMKYQSYDILIGYLVRIVLCVTLILISFMNRTQPVVIFDDSINLEPFTGLMCFPTGVRNGVSVWMWTLSCNLSLRLFYGLLKTRLGSQKQ